MIKKINIKEAVKDNKKVYFVKFFENELYYRTENNEIFTISLEEAKGATFLAEDKAILFMRFMRIYNSENGY